jgi:hypothetical protein
MQPLLNKSEADHLKNLVAIYQEAGTTQIVVDLLIGSSLPSGPLPSQNEGIDIFPPKSGSRSTDILRVSLRLPNLLCRGLTKSRNRDFA